MLRQADAADLVRVAPSGWASIFYMVPVGELYAEPGSVGVAKNVVIFNEPENDGCGEWAGQNHWASFWAILHRWCNDGQNIARKLVVISRVWGRRDGIHRFEMHPPGDGARASIVIDEKPYVPMRQGLGLNRERGTQVGAFQVMQRSLVAFDTEPPNRNQTVSKENQADIAHLQIRTKPRWPVEIALSGVGLMLIGGFLADRRGVYGGFLIIVGAYLAIYGPTTWLLLWT